MMKSTVNLDEQLFAISQIYYNEERTKATAILRQAIDSSIVVDVGEGDSEYEAVFTAFCKLMKEKEIVLMKSINNEQIWINLTRGEQVGWVVHSVQSQLLLPEFLKALITAYKNFLD